MFEIHFFKFNSCHTILRCADFSRAIKSLKDYRNSGMPNIWLHKKYAGEYALVKHFALN